MDRLALSIVAALAGGVSAQPVNTNLVVNGDAETGDTTGWISGGIVARPPDPFSAGFGDWVFTGELGPVTESLLQDIPIGSLAGAVDAGALRAVLSLYIQSRGNGPAGDVGTATFSFRSATGTTLGEVSYTDPPDAVFAWVNFGEELPVPQGSRTIRVLLSARRDFGKSTDAFFDEISVRLLGCNPADLAPPFALLDLADIVAFVTAFTSLDPLADLNPDTLFDLADVVAFITAFNAGCP